MRTLTFHPDRPHPLSARVETFPYRFDDPTALTRSLEGVSTLYNTFWVRFDHGPTSFANAIESSRMLFYAAKRAGVERIVHLSIANPSIESSLPYYRGKALVEYALAQSGLHYSIVRPSWIFSELVALVRSAVSARSPIIHIPPFLMAAAARALGLLVRDVVLTPDEIKGLMAGLRVSRDPALGRVAFSQWLDEHKASVGRSYANELQRHFATKV